MKVFNLQCGEQHQFEGWFASEEDYLNQTERGLLECPLCADKAVRKLPSAPRINLGAAAPAPSPQANSAQREEVVANPELQAEIRQFQAAYLQFARRVVAETEDVGTRFAEAARKIHYGESEERGIRGKASREETEALLEEGITVMPLPVPEGFNGPLQ
ncbi:DUF1178 family protein [Leptospira sp. 96542]|nr:DUF1178 family protein [Leptospira sp. 96542]